MKFGPPHFFNRPKYLLILYNWHARRDSFLRLPSVAAETQTPFGPSFRIQQTCTCGMFPRLAIPYLIYQIYINGTPGGIRTPDLRIRSPLLYPAELLAQACINLKNNSENNILPDLYSNQSNTLEKFCIEVKLRFGLKYCDIPVIKSGIQ
jgi:hypothetical protein